jgi:hypothetical protein
MEHRWGQRRRTDVTVRIFAAPSIVGMGHVLNISPTGAYMETAIALRKMSLVYLEPFNRDWQSESVGRIAATVVRSNAAGVGLEWCEFATEMTQAYARMTTRLPWGSQATGRS